MLANTFLSSVLFALLDFYTALLGSSPAAFLAMLATVAFMFAAPVFLIAAIADAMEAAKKA